MKIHTIFNAIVLINISLITTLSSAPTQAENARFLKQNWTNEDRDYFYYTPQGSELFPLDWFLALEQPNNEALFSDVTHMRSFGWLYNNDTAKTQNNHKLPIGFTKNPASNADEPIWLGLNCAACHTSELRTTKTLIRIDGGAATIDLDRFLVSLSKAVSNTRKDKAKFKRFFDRIISNGTSLNSIKVFRNNYNIFATRFTRETKLRHPEFPAGPARIDAMGQIINSLSDFFLEEPDNHRTASAPVSIPSLWLTPRMKPVQWNATAKDPLPRNIGQVMGVFGNANLTDSSGTLFKSSALVGQINKLEELATKLTPPKWNESLLGSVKIKLVEKGKQLFDEDCSACHEMPSFNDNGETIKVESFKYDGIGTDPLHTLNVINRKIKTGKLSKCFSGKSVVSARVFLLKIVGEITRQAVVDSKNNESTPAHQSKCIPFTQEEIESLPKFDRLKAGPLVGIWATSPYLHNGSVRTLYSLLSPVNEREESFYIGSSDFDSTKIGYLPSKPTDGFLFDTTQPGNSNKGHVYPEEGYSREDRLAVIEYLKMPELFAK